MQHHSLQKYYTLNPGLDKSLRARFKISQAQSQILFAHWSERVLVELLVRHTDNNPAVLAKIAPLLQYPYCSRDSYVFDHRVTSECRLWIVHNDWDSLAEVRDKETLVRKTREFGVYFDAILQEFRVCSSRLGGEIAVGLNYYRASPALSELIESIR